VKSIQHELLWQFKAQEGVTYPLIAIPSSDQHPGKKEATHVEVLRGFLMSEPDQGGFFAGMEIRFSTYAQ
jgi:hypothetical protein